MQAYLEALARAALVLVLSDLHWGDEVVLELVDRLLAALRALPFMLLATARPDLEERWTPAPGRHNVAVLHLDPLDADATVALVEVHLKASDPELVAELRDRSGGNPLFIEELAALIRDSDGAIGADGARAFDSGDLPVTLRGLGGAARHASATLDRGARGLRGRRLGGPRRSRRGAGRRPVACGSRARLSALADRDLVVLEDGEFAFKSS